MGDDDLDLLHVGQYRATTADVPRVCQGARTGGEVSTATLSRMPLVVRATRRAGCTSTRVRLSGTTVSGLRRGRPRRRLAAQESSMTALARSSACISPFIELCTGLDSSHFFTPLSSADNESDTEVASPSAAK
jgi:hypothetical protein